MNGGIDWKALGATAKLSARRCLYIVVIYLAIMFGSLAIWGPHNPAP